MRKKNLHNIKLKATACIMFCVWVISGCLLDSTSWIHSVVCLGSFAWLMLFGYANGWTNDYYGGDE